jgi:hypothetical protein
MPLKHLQYVQHPRSTCNIHTKQLQHTSETSQTIKTYACNMLTSQHLLAQVMRHGGHGVDNGHDFLVGNSGNGSTSAIPQQHPSMRGG